MNLQVLQFDPDSESFPSSLSLLLLFTPSTPFLKRQITNNPQTPNQKPVPASSTNPPSTPATSQHLSTSSQAISPSHQQPTPSSPPLPPTPTPTLTNPQHPRPLLHQPNNPSTKSCTLPNPEPLPSSPPSQKTPTAASLRSRRSWPPPSSLRADLIRALSARRRVILQKGAGMLGRVRAASWMGIC
jgi:hypothetical protein